MNQVASTPTSQGSQKAMPVVFLAHGAPPTLDDDGWMKSFAGWSAAMPKPKAVLMISAHWLNSPVTLGATTTVPLVYDFYGFPQRYYEMTYASPGAPELADRVDSLLGEKARRKDRGLDHGAFIPLMGMYPRADVPVLTMSIPTMDAKPLYELGKKLAPLREEGVLIAGSGFITHNLRAVDFGPRPQVPSWARDFDGWIADALVRNDVDALLAYREKAPGVAESLPTHEHFVPLLVSLGAASSTLDKPAFPIEGWVFGPMTKRSVQWS